VTTLEQYELQIKSGELKADAQQADVVALLDGIESKLLAGTPWSPPSSGFFANLFSNKKHTVKPVTGLYLWGGD